MNKRYFRIGALSLYTFILIFQPPFTPISQVYITGIITVVLLAAEYRHGDVDKTMKRSRIDLILVALIFMTAYLLVVSTVNLLFIEDADVTTNRLRCFNQLFVLTSIQISGVLFILTKAQRWGLSLDDIFLIALIAAMLESFCVLTAYFVPQIRSYFLMFADDIYQNPWQHERRGYGFSSTLLDTFGYGIGVLCCVLLVRPMRSKITNTVCVALLVFSAFLNSRTGLLVIILVVAIWLFRRKGGLNSAVWAIILVTSLFAFVQFAPEIASIMNQSESVTVRWIGSAISDFHLLVTGSSEVENIQFIDDIVPIPANPIELIFGSGHSVYDTGQELGFRSDIGYFNIIWTYGIIGMVAYYAFFLYVGWMAFSANKERRYRTLVLSIVLVFFLVQFKGNVLGASPGICITYLCLFSLICYREDTDNTVLEKKCRDDLCFNTKTGRTIVKPYRRMHLR